MKDNSENIDKIFQDGLASHEVNPPSDVWLSINEGLFYRAFKDKFFQYKSGAPHGVWPGIRTGIVNPIRPQYVKIAAAAAVIAVFISGAWWTVQRNFFNPDLDQIVAQTELAAVGLQDPTESETAISEGTPIRNVYVEPPTTNPGIESGVLLTNNTLALADDESFAYGNSSLAEANESSQNTLLKPFGIAEDEFLAEPEGDRYFSVVETKPILDFSDISTPGTYPMTASTQPPITESYKWAVSGNVSPLFSFRYANTESSKEGMEYFYGKESGIMSFSGGVNAIYRLKSRLSVQAGVQFSRGGQRINDVIFYQDVQTGRLLSSGIFNGDIPYPFETSLGTITSGDYIHYITDFKLPDGELYTGDLIANPEFENYEALNTFLTQNLEFIEVPLLVKYKLVDRKLGLNVLSGLGASFLVDNSVYMNYMGEQFLMGETKNISGVNLIGTFGLGLDYSINRKLSLNLEPTIKYFLNSMNTGSQVSSHPYFFGVYSGVSVSF